MRRMLVGLVLVWLGVSFIAVPSYGAPGGGSTGGSSNKSAADVNKNGSVCRLPSGLYVDDVDGKCPQDSRLEPTFDCDPPPPGPYYALACEHDLVPGFGGLAFGGLATAGNASAGYATSVGGTVDAVAVADGNVVVNTGVGHASANSSAVLLGASGAVGAPVNAGGAIGGAAGAGGGAPVEVISAHVDADLEGGRASAHSVAVGTPADAVAIESASVRSSGSQAETVATREVAVSRDGDVRIVQTRTKVDDDGKSIDTVRSILVDENVVRIQRSRAGSDGVVTTRGVVVEGGSVTINGVVMAQKS